MKIKAIRDSSATSGSGEGSIANPLWMLFSGKRILRTLAILMVATAIAGYGSTSDADSRCKAIAKTKLTRVTITASQSVPAGAFTPPGSDRPIPSIPAFCRVAATLRPTPDSNIKIELWMPENNWNGRFLGTGNGGGAGKISYGGLEFGLRRGYATANTDMGTSPNADAIVGHPERWADFGYRGTHEMTSVSQAILKKYYRKPQSYSYFEACSTGGQQALMEAQRYPADYNGILAGAPANNRTHLHAGFIWNFKATNQLPDSALLPPEKIALVTRVVVAACAGKDGGAPGDDFLTDPRKCNFDPGSIPKCGTTDNGACLTGAQLIALKKIYAGPTNPRTGERIYTPLPFGSENSPLGVAYQQNPDGGPKQFYFYRWVFGSNFDYRKFDFDRDQDTVDARLAAILNANNPDLSGLRKRGGKLLMYTGTADPLVPFQDALNYYERVVQAQQGKLAGAESSNALAQTQEFFRYFLVPGMGHCGGGPGLNDLEPLLSAEIPQDSEPGILAALVKWVEQGVAPNQIIATAFVDADPKEGIRFQRPICPYPKFPDYIGGDRKSPSSFQCTEHPRDSVLTPAERYLR